MKTCAYGLDLKQDPALVQQTLVYHRAVWPEVVASLKRIGVRGNRIYAVGTRLFMVLETDDDFDPVHDLSRYTEEPRAREWDELMRTLQQPLPETRPGQWWRQ